MKAEAVGLFFAATAFLLACLGIYLGLQLVFWLTWGIALTGWVWQYLKLRQPDLPRPLYGQIFSQNVWLGFVLLAGMIGGSILS